MINKTLCVCFSSMLFLSTLALSGTQTGILSIFESNESNFVNKLRQLSADELSDIGNQVSSEQYLYMDSLNLNVRALTTFQKSDGRRGFVLETEDGQTGLVLETNIGDVQTIIINE